MLDEGNEDRRLSKLCGAGGTYSGGCPCVLKIPVDSGSTSVFSVFNEAERSIRLCVARRLLDGLSLSTGVMGVTKMLGVFAVMVAAAARSRGVIIGVTGVMLDNRGVVSPARTVPAVLGRLIFPPRSRLK